MHWVKINNRRINLDLVGDYEPMSMENSIMVLLRYPSPEVATPGQFNHIMAPIICKDKKEQVEIIRFLDDHTGSSIRGNMFWSVRPDEEDDS